MANKRILIVDDETAIREIIVSIGEIYGFDVVQASNGQEAINILSRDTDFSVIVSDNKMPEKSGLDILRWIHLNSIKIPFIIQSGFSSADYEVEARNLGLFGYIEKPWEAKDILALIKQATTKE